MFDLSDADLDRSILDCCAGAASFTAELTGRGGSALAVDPAYAQGRDEVLAAIGTGTTGTAQLIDAHQDRFVWHWYGSPERRDQLRTAAAGRFAGDYVSRPHAYVAGALPNLPFQDGAFDLVLCSHLLFTWSDRFGEDWHRQALRELRRVARREVRVFPLVVQGTGAAVPFLDTLVEEFGAELRTVPFEFQVGANQLLAVSN